MQEAFGHHGHDEIALPAAGGADQILEPQLADSSEHGLDGSVGPSRVKCSRSENSSCMRRVSSASCSATLSMSSISRYSIAAPVEVLAGEIRNLLADAEGASEEVCAVGLASVVACGGGYMDSAGSSGHEQL